MASQVPQAPPMIRPLPVQPISAMQYLPPTPVPAYPMMPQTQPYYGMQQFPQQIQQVAYTPNGFSNGYSNGYQQFVRPPPKKSDPRLWFGVIALIVLGAGLVIFLKKKEAKQLVEKSATPIAP